MADAPDAPKKPGFFALSLLANHFPQLHGVRVLAIVLVVQFHVTFALLDGKLPIDPGWGTLSATVFFGMDLFFVLSGFLIGTMILYSLDQSSRPWRRRLPRAGPAAARRPRASRAWCRARRAGRQACPRRIASSNARR